MNEPPGSPPARRPLRPDDGRVLPRAGRQGRAAVHRQHLPLRPGGVRGLGAARPDALGGRLPADARDRDGWAPGADHLDQPGIGHVDPGGLRPGGRPHRPGAGVGVRAPERDDDALARRSPRRGSTRPSTRSTRPRRSSSRTSSARSTTRSRPRSRRTCSATRSSRTSSRSSGSTSSPTRTRSRSTGRASSSASSASRSSSPRSSPGRDGEYVPVDETVRSFREILDGTHDDLPESAFYMKGSIDQVTGTEEKGEKDEGVEREKRRGRRAQGAGGRGGRGRSDEKSDSGVRRWLTTTRSTPRS